MPPQLPRSTSVLRSVLVPSRLLTISFATIIALGAAALFLLDTGPPGGRPVTALDALFTSTSAVCVTGLIVRDTGSEFSFAGEVIVLLLIQAGGLGILTFSNLAILAIQGRIGVRGRMVLDSTYGSFPRLPVGRILTRVFVYTAVFETLGALLLTLRFLRDFPLAEAVWQGVFHSISAYCNAGFSLFSQSLMDYALDPVIQPTMMALIVLGGLGAVVHADLEAFWRGRRARPRARTNLHTKVVLGTTAILIPGGAALFFLFETGGATMPDGVVGRSIASLFLSITARTAGFNSVDTAALTNASLLILIGLMFIGGSPGSTAGGIKTTTAAVLFAAAWSRVLNRPKVELWKRSVPSEVLVKALVTVLSFAIILFLAVIALEITELRGRTPEVVRAGFIEHLFEVVSALCTVGLSTGVTTELSAPGRVVIILCMYLGRLGPLVVANSLIGTRRRPQYHYPEGRLTVG